MQNGDNVESLLCSWTQAGSYGEHTPACHVVLRRLTVLRRFAVPSTVG
jgi:hypothetical protein